MRINRIVEIFDELNFPWLQFITSSITRLKNAFWSETHTLNKIGKTSLLMLYTKFQGNLLKVFTIHGLGGLLDHLTRTIWRHSSFSLARRLYMKLFEISSAVSEEVLWNFEGHSFLLSLGQINEWYWPLALINVHVVSILISQTPFFFCFFFLEKMYRFILFFLSFSLSKPKNQIWSCREVGKGQPSHYLNKFGSIRLPYATCQVSSHLQQGS